MIYLCCHCHYSMIEKPSHFYEALTGWGTISLAVGTIILAVMAICQLGDIRDAIKHYTFNAFLNQEKELLNKRNALCETMLSIDRLSRRHPLDFAEIASLTTKQKFQVDDLINSLERLAKEILQKRKLEVECKRTYQLILNETYDDYREYIIINRYKSIMALKKRWEQK
jgi:hypothetical protein